MVTRVPGVLEQYKFDDEEEMYSAVVFTDMQVMHLTNELSAAYEMKMAIASDEAMYEKPESFVRAHEYMRGKIEVLKWILNTHEEAKRRQLTTLNFERAKREVAAEFEARTQSTQTSSSI